jgi:hypothetical protein
MAMADDLGEPYRQRHEQNKREAFDAMRAYHQSEIAHKAHTVEVIKTLLTVVVGAYGGLIALILKAELAPSYAQATAALLLLGVSGTVLYVVCKTNEKIEADHQAYEAHRAEYLAERQLLKIDEVFAPIGYQTHWRPRDVDHPSGYSFTKRITVALGWIVVLAAILGAILSIAASLTREPSSGPPYVMAPADVHPVANNTPPARIRSPRLLIANG